MGINLHETLGEALASDADAMDATVAATAAVAAPTEHLDDGRSANARPGEPTFTASSTVLGTDLPSGRDADRAERAPARTDVVRQAATETRPVLQLVSVPIPLDPKEYANARSNSNPKGDLRPLYRFRDLVDPLPALTAYYTPKGSAENLYGLVVSSASAKADSPFVQSVLAAAQKAYAQNSFSNLDSNSGSWRPCYAVPDNWYDVDAAAYKSIKLDLNSSSSGGSAFALVGGQQTADSLTWSLGGGQRTQPLDADTVIQGVTFQGIQVFIRRPWFRPTLFSTQGWYLGNQPVGYLSDGKLDGNRGEMPLLPVSLLVGYNVSITADWAPADKAVLDAAASGRESDLSLGQFALSSKTSAGFVPDVSGNTVTSPALQVIGWFSSVIPQSPAMARP